MGDLMFGILVGRRSDRVAPVRSRCARALRNSRSHHWRRNAASVRFLRRCPCGPTRTGPVPPGFLLRRPGGPTRDAGLHRILAGAENQRECVVPWQPLYLRRPELPVWRHVPTTPPFVTYPWERLRDTKSARS